MNVHVVLLSTITNSLPKNCLDCNELRKSSEFDCAWCDSVHRCSDGADRLREHWESNGCAAKNISGDGQGRQSGSDRSIFIWNSEHFKKLFGLVI